MRELICSGMTYINDITTLAQLLHTDPSAYTYTRALELQQDVEQIIKPRFLIKELPVSKNAAGQTLVNGMAIDSRIVPQRIGEQKTLLAYIISCGPEIAAYMNSVEDALDNYILDQIAYVGYLQAKAAMLDHVTDVWGIEHYNMLSPGSIIDWPVAEVIKIFDMLDGVYQQLNIHVMESGLIDPLKSTSGFLVINDEEFHSCEICERPNCPNRVSPYDEEKYVAMVNQE